MDEHHQISGLGGLVPNTVLMNWPQNWMVAETKTRRAKAYDFANIVKTANAEEKTVIVAKDPRDFPTAPCHGLKCYLIENPSACVNLEYKFCSTRSSLNNGIQTPEGPMLIFVSDGC